MQPSRLWPSWPITQGAPRAGRSSSGLKQREEFDGRRRPTPRPSRQPCVPSRYSASSSPRAARAAAPRLRQRQAQRPQRIDAEHGAVGCIHEAMAARRHRAFTIRARSRDRRARPRWARGPPRCASASAAATQSAATAATSRVSTQGRRFAAMQAPPQRVAPGRRPEEGPGQQHQRGRPHRRQQRGALRQRQPGQQRDHGAGRAEADARHGPQPQARSPAMAAPSARPVRTAAPSPTCIASSASPMPATTSMAGASARARGSSSTAAITAAPSTPAADLQHSGWSRQPSQHQRPRARSAASHCTRRRARMASRPRPSNAAAA